MKKIYNDVTFNLEANKSIVNHGGAFTVSLTASGLGAKQGLKIPYRILNGPSPYGSDIILLDFTYDKDTDYYYLTAKLSKDLGSDTLEVVQLNGPPVKLEKVNQTVYKYKNPLDREEVSRAFRATLKSYSTENNMVKGVRAFDFTYTNEYGYFELDKNLKATKTFTNRMSLLSPIDRVFNLSLYYMPQYSTSILFKNKYTPPQPYPEQKDTTEVTIGVTALAKSTYEGTEASFKITYKNIRKNFKLDYQFIDSKDTYNQEGYFITDDKGFFTVKVPVDIVELNSSSSRYVKLWIKGYPHISDIMYINILERAPYSERFKPGVHTIQLQPYTDYEITLIGAGGAGGCAVNNRDGNWNVDAAGGPGEDTKVELNNNSVVAGGGKGGADGHAHNDSAYHDGAPGKEGTANITNIGTTFVIKEQKNGNPGHAWDRTDHTGGVAITSLGDKGYNGKGGTGANGTRWSSSGGYDYGFGAGGGSGSLVICTVKNGTSKTQDMSLTVGKAGKVFDMNAKGTWGNVGFIGEHGFAIIQSI